MDKRRTCSAGKILWHDYCSGATEAFARQDRWLNTKASFVLEKKRLENMKKKKVTAPKTRAHKVLFDQDAPFRAKVYRDRTKYQRKSKYKEY